MDQLDRDILNIIQTDFPVDLHPYRVLADKLGKREEEIFERVIGLYESGVIRRIGASFKGSRLGYVSTLCTAEVPEEKIDAFVQAVNVNPGVTHNYRRNHDYNIWFTMSAPSWEELEGAIEKISQQTGIRPIRHLPATKSFKLEVNLAL